MIQDIEACELGIRFANEKDRFLLVDVRTDEEFFQGHIPSSLHIPIDQMEERYEELKEQSQILLICKSGRRSELVGKFLIEKGFSNLYNLKGGVDEWTGPLVAIG